jgi:hypothetical protein
MYSIFLQSTVRYVLYSYGFCFDFFFHLVFTLNLHVFVAVYLKCFSAISFIVRDLSLSLELSEASPSRWN